MKEIYDLLNKNNIKYKSSNNKLIIYNTNKEIEIINDKNEEYIVCFETSHCHFNDIDGVYDYVYKIINDELFPIEFYYDDKRKFGGDISKEFYDNLSIKSLAEYFYFDEDTISGFSYEIYSWSGEYDVKRQPILNLEEK